MARKLLRDPRQAGGCGTRLRHTFCLTKYPLYTSSRSPQSRALYLGFEQSMVPVLRGLSTAHRNLREGKGCTGAGGFLEVAPQPETKGKTCFQEAEVGDPR